ncbi:DUF4381 family protein [Lysobacter sp. A3-1-A15]|uniref:DUF4381 family protein n=1 Tax=Novilysobacter viscosus TaxID=3098602 RepID=UPI002ED9F892
MDGIAMIATLVLRDVHQPPAPSWWPPAPGWWVVFGAIAVLGALLAAWRLHRRRRRQRIARWFDTAVDQAGSASQQVAVMSDLLRRAARRHDPAADRLDAAAWLALLDGDDAHRPFTTGPGQVLALGGYRPDTSPAEVDALRPLALARFMQWMDAG